VDEVRKLGEIRNFPSERCRQKASSLLSAMTLREKIGQMTQPHIDSVRDHSLIVSRSIGSVLSGGDNDPPDNRKLSWATMVSGFQRASEKSRLKIPLLYGIDAVHGHNNVEGAVIFPHNIGLGATRDADLVRRVGRVTAREVRATGIDWTFAPVVAAAQDERWGRTYESFGENHELSSELGVALIQGLQGERLGGPESVLACAKHFLGDGNTEGGQDRGESTMDNLAQLAPLIESYRKAVEAQVASVMVSFSSLNGVNMHCNGPLITDTLKHDLAFTGFVVTDWSGVERIAGQNYQEKLTGALNAGVDMVMNPEDFDTFHRDFEALVPNQVSTERIDDAVYRILSMKCEAGLFDQTPGQAQAHSSTEINQELLDAVGSMPHREVAREAVRKSLVLLKNDEAALPLQKSGETIHISGRAANDLGLQCGGWTIEWQGGSGAITEGTTILEGLRRKLGPDLLKYSPERTPSPSTDTAVVVIGEEPYAEWEGDSSDLALSQVDIESVRRARSTAKKVVVVLVTGRPLILEPILDLADALVIAWLPGTEGDGVADVLFGDYAPTGRLSHSWPRTLSQVPINLGDENYDPLYPYDFGLTYPKVIR
jgi:beta-glucosidase